MEETNRSFRLWLLLLLAALALTGLYAWGPARARMDSGTTAVVLVHIGLGLLLAPALLALGGWIWRHRAACLWSVRLGWWCALAALLSGAGLLSVAASGRVSSALVLAAHIVAGLAGTALLTLRLGGRGRHGAVGEDADPGHAPPMGIPGPLAVALLRARSMTAPRVALATLLLLLGSLAVAAVMPRVGSGRKYDAEAYYRSLTSTNARQAENPLFPAGTSVEAPPGSRWAPAASCGAAGCHPKAYHQWLGSAHQGAGTAPLYRQVVARFERERGPEARRWCDGCHAPAAVVKTHLTDATDSSHFLESAAAEGVDCISCHAVQHADLSGNGRLDLRLPAQYPFAEHPDPRLRWLHGFLIRLRPEPHRRAFDRPDPQRQSDLCASCHRLSLNLPQNRYKFLRAADEHGTWQTGPYSGESIHGFAPPGPRQRCQDCHSPHGDLHTGSGSGAGQSLVTPAAPVPPVSVDLLAIRLPSPRVGAPEEWIAPLQHSTPRLRRGDSALVDVVISNQASGHQFPSGIGDLEGAWIELQVRGASGRLLFTSRPSPLPSSAPSYPEPGEHIYGMVGLDRAGRRLVHGELWNMVTPLFHRSILPGQPDLDRRTIQPGEADVARYRLRVPRSTSGRLQLRALLWQGYLTRTATQMATAAGIRAPVTARLLAQDSIELPLLAPSRRVTSGPDGGEGHAGQAKPVANGRSVSPVAEPRRAVRGLPDRYYAYGIGLLRQGDLPRAQRAMRQVQALAPHDPDGYYGLGRVYLTEGDLLAARGQFEQARRLAPSDPRPQALFAMTERRMGQYDGALAELTRLARAYPRDRVLWFEIGMCRFLAGRYEEGVRAFETVLEIDPDDLAAHYNLMRCLRRLRRVPEARREEVIYQNLREDDDAKKVGLTFLKHHPWADRETRTIHEHPLYPATGAPQ